MAFLTAVYDDFTYANVAGVLQQIFNEQYTLAFTPEVEIRYRTETRTGTSSWTDSEGNTHTETYTYTVEVPYEEGYGPEDIQAIIEGRASLPKSRAETPRKVNLIIDIQSKMRDGKGSAYAKWATVYNLKAMAAALQYFQESGLLEYEQLEQKAAEVTDRFHSLSDKIKNIETSMIANSDLKAALVDYAKTRPVFEGYKAAKYSKKYFAEHEADIQLYRAAQATFKRVLAGAKLPKMDTLKKEYQKLAAEKSAAYKDYRAARKGMQDIITAKANIDHLLGLTDTQKNKEMER